MNNKPNNNDKNTQSISLLIVGIIFIFIPPLSIIGIILLFIYFGGQSKNDIMDQLNKEINKEKNKEANNNSFEMDKEDYQVDEKDFKFNEPIYTISELQSSQDLIPDDIDFENKKKDKEVFENNSFNIKDEGPIKYYK